ncbi:MAG: HEPN domain-containing protein [Candidatus Tectomicrobia bacterium]|nr:HEPN domain-containing protein [Candidatus Tectomicrobia bacterium]
MRDDQYEQEIVANLERAEESVQAARVLMAAGHFDFAASRAYYAVFYAATAALLAEGLEFSKHTGVIAAIHQNFVRTGKLDRQLGRDLNWLFELRNIGDYGETRHVPPDNAEKAIEAAEAFLHAIKELLGRGGNTP